MLHALGLAMTENVPEANSEYAEVAEEHEEDVLVVGVLETFTNFRLSGSCLKQAPVHNPYFLTLFVLH
jgi:hypothetical protein